MKKLKLLFLTVALLCSVGSWAQEWTAPVIPSSDISQTNTGYYAIYNIKADAFMGEGMSYGTQAVACRLEGGYSASLADRQKFTLIVNGSTVKMVHKNHTDKGVGYTGSGADNVYADYASNNEWTFAASPNYSNAYTLTISYGTLDVVSKWGGKLCVTSEGKGYTDWAFIPEANLSDGSFAKWKERKAMYDVYQALVASSSTSTYSSALSTAKAVYDNSSASISDLRAATRALIIATSDGIQRPTDVSALFTNSNMQQDGTTGWTTDASTKGGGAIETYKSAITLTQNKTDVPNGLYTLIFHGMYRVESGSDAAPSFTAESGASSKNENIPLMADLASTWNVYGGADWSGDNGTQYPNKIWRAAEGLAYEDASARIENFHVTGNALTLTATESSNTHWFVFNSFDIIYQGPTLASSAIAFTSGSTMTAGQWYYVDIDEAGVYSVSATTLSDIVYTTNGTTLTSAAVDASFSSLSALEATRYYVKSTSSQTLTIENAVNADATLYITNPSFETNSTTGWTVTSSDDTGAKENDNATYTMSNVDGNYLFNIWQTGNTISQTLTGLPAGNYKLTAVMGTDAGATFYLKMDDNTGIAYSSEDGKGVGVTVTVYAKLDAAGDLTISADAGGSQWYKVDNFQLTYNPTLPASLTGISGKMNSTVESTQTTAIAAYNAESGQTIANLLDAQAAIYAAQQSKLVYNDITTIKNTYDTKASNLDAAGQAAYTTATTVASTGAETKYTEGTYTTAAEAETAYQRDYYTAVEAVATDGTDLTGFITNPSFETGDNTGWHYAADGGQTNFNDPLSEGRLVEGGGNYYKSYWAENANGKVYQTINLPAGTYTLSVYVATSTGQTLKLKAGSETTTTTAESTDAFRMEVSFSVATAQNVEISVGSDNAGAWYNMDDFKLVYKNTNKDVIIANKGDITSLINGEFETNTDGWTGNYVYVQNLWRNWRGESLNKYIECQSNGSMTCTLANMPAGTYKVVAAARAYYTDADNFGVIQPEIAGTTGTSLTGVGDIAQSGASEINTNGVQMPYSSLGGFTTASAGHRWQWISATGTLASAGDLVINFNCTGTRWMSIDDVHLYCTEMDGTSYTQTLSTISGNTSVTNTGNASVVTCDIVMSNPNAIISSSAAINGAAGTQINNNLVDGTIANMVLYDGTNTFTAPAGSYAATAATLYRSLPADTWCTLVLPFVPSTEFTYKKTPSSLSDGTLTFGDATPANDAPMLVKNSEALTSVTGAREAAETGGLTAGSGVPMQGVYTAGNVPQSEGSNIYYALGNDNKLHKVTGTGVTIRPFRAYFHLGNAADARSVIMLNFDDVDTTGIESLTPALSGEGAQVIYDLQGRKVQKPSRGMYIINGKKVVIK